MLNQRKLRTGSTLGLGNSGHDAGFRLQALPDQALNLRPEVRIARTLNVVGHERPVKPGRSLAPDRGLVVIVAIVAEDLCLGAVGGADKRPAMDQAMRLEEIHGGGDVFGNDSIALPEFGYAVDLHGEQHRDAHTIQLASEKNNRRCPPTMTEEDDMGLRFFLIGKDSIVIAIKQAKNLLVGRLPVAILEDLNVSSVRDDLLDALGQLYRAMVRVVVAYESAGEPDDDGGSIGRAAAHDRSILREKWNS